MSTPRDMINTVRSVFPNLRSVEINVLTSDTFEVVVDPYNEAIHRLIEPAVKVTTPEDMTGLIRGKYKTVPDPNIMGKTIKVPWTDGD